MLFPSHTPPVPSSNTHTDALQFIINSPLQVRAPRICMVKKHTTVYYLFSSFLTLKGWFIAFHKCLPVWSRRLLLFLVNPYVLCCLLGFLFLLPLLDQDFRSREVICSLLTEDRCFPWVLVVATDTHYYVYCLQVVVWYCLNTRNISQNYETYLKSWGVRLISYWLAVLLVCMFCKNCATLQWAQHRS